jgi:hypothetical protein
MQICKLKDGQPVDKRELPDSHNGVSLGGRIEPMLADGWRLYWPDPTADIKTSHWEDTGIGCRQIVDSLWTAEERAQQAADAAEQAAITEALRLATPLKFDQPIQAKIETLAADGHIYGIEVDPNGDEIIPVQRESTRLTQAEYESARAAKLAVRAAHRLTMGAIKTDLDQVETALDQVDVSTTGTLGVAVAATTGVNKTALQEVRKVLVDLKAAAKNLRQAAEKIRKEIR